MFEVTKVCFKCGIEKPLSAFYKHPRMADGHLNKCKECTKKDSIANYNIKSQDETWMEKERERGKEKFKRLGYQGKFKSPSAINALVTNTKRLAKRLGFAKEGTEFHHWCYKETNQVFRMSRKAHRRLHLKIYVNYEDGFTYTLDGEKIDTSEKAMTIYQKIVKESGMDETIEFYDLDAIARSRGRKSTNNQ